MVHRVLHVVKRSYLDPKLSFHGSTKDIAGRSEYFKARGLETMELAPDRHDDCGLLTKLEGIDLRRFDVVVIEYPRFPESVRYVRSMNPRIRVLVRSHNAEFIHHVHTAVGSWATALDDWSGRLVKSAKAGLHSLVHAVVRGQGDLACGRQADAVLSICDWETSHYWRWVAPTTKVFTVPYYLPRRYTVNGRYAGERQRTCVCLTSAAPGPLVELAAQNFVRLVERAGERARGWSFSVTGKVSAGRGAGNNRVKLLGHIEDPFAVLRGASAMALLSSLGMGFKTKILDAVQEGCYTLVPPRLLRRLPPEVQPFCIAVSPRSVDSFLEGLEATRRPLPADDPNVLLRARAYAAMDAALGL